MQLGCALFQHALYFFVFYPSVLFYDFDRILTAALWFEFRSDRDASQALVVMSDEDHPGFSPTGQLKHLSRVKSVIFAGRGTFVSLTSTTLKTWSTIHQGLVAPVEVAQFQLPQVDLVSACCTCLRNNLLLGTCLDGTLRIWSLDKLVLRSSCPLDRSSGMTTQLLYNPT